MIFETPKLPLVYAQVVEKIVDLRKRLSHMTSDNLNRWHGYLARMSFAHLIHGSNTMEGIQATFEEAVAAVDGEESPNPANEDWKALVGHREAMDYIIQLSKEPSFPYNAGTLLGLHFMMMKYDLNKYPGRLRPGPIFVTNMVTGQKVYDGPSAADVPILFGELIDSLNNDRQNHVLIRAAMAHLNLTMIHPFKDGNGRMARALQTMVLARDGILDPRFSSIEEYVGKNAQAYYGVLAEVGKGIWNPERSALPWIQFCLIAHYDQAARLLRRAEETDALWTRLEYFIERHGLADRMIHALSRAASPRGVVSSASYRLDADLSPQVAKRDLKSLMDAKILVAHGERRGRCYTAGPDLQQMWRETRAKRPIPNPFDLVVHDVENRPTQTAFFAEER
jgi:Fic family protein